MDRRERETRRLEVKLSGLWTAWEQSSTRGPQVRPCYLTIRLYQQRAGKCKAEPAGVQRQPFREGGLVTVFSRGHVQTRLFILGWRKLSGGTFKTCEQYRPSETGWCFLKAGSHFLWL